jgi:hypothetical protein
MLAHYFTHPSIQAHLLLALTVICIVCFVLVVVIDDKDSNV